MSNGIYNELKLLQPWLNPEPGSMLILGEKIEKLILVLNIYQNINLFTYRYCIKYNIKIERI